MLFIGTSSCSHEPDVLSSVLNIKFSVKTTIISVQFLQFEWNLYWWIDGSIILNKIGINFRAFVKILEHRLFAVDNKKATLTFRVWTCTRIWPWPWLSSFEMMQCLPRTASALQQIAGATLSVKTKYLESFYNHVNLQWCGNTKNLNNNKNKNQIIKKYWPYKNVGLAPKGHKENRLKRF